MYYRTDYMSPVGKLSLVSDGECLIGLWIEGQKYFQSTLSEGDVEKKGNKVEAGKELRMNDSILQQVEDHVLRLTQDWLDRYFAGGKPDVSELPLAPAGSEFRRVIWRLLCEIPYGEVVTYGELAKKAAAAIGRERMSAQAVGGAVGHNPISIIIPCHRVVGADGSLTGYAGGVDKKAWLLELEGVDISEMQVSELPERLRFS